MTTPNHDPSIEHEPFWQQDGFQADPSEGSAAEQLSRAARKETEDDRVEHTVWDETAWLANPAGTPPPDALTYARWLDKRIAETSGTRSWLMVALVALTAGPWAILGALLGGGQTTVGVAVIVVFGPVLEEMMKVAIPLWLVEKRPFLFRSRVQIALCVLASGFVFSAVENVLYLHVYVAKPSNFLIQWRWSACVALHMGCSLIAGMGLMRIWAQVMARRTPPRLAAGSVYLIAAMGLHAAYNAFAVFLELFNFRI